MTDLIERLEKEGGSRELDAEIFRALDYQLPDEFASKKISLDWRPDGSAMMEVGDMVVSYTPPPFTQSLDAAIALCERVLPGWCWKVGTCHVSDDAWVCPDWNDPVHGERLKAELGEPEFGTWKDVGFDVDLRPSGRVPVALCIAILKALRALEDGK